MFKQASLRVDSNQFGLLGRLNNHMIQKIGATDLISLYCSDLAMVGIYSKRYMVFADMSAVCPMKEHNETDNRGRPDLPHLLF